MFRSLYLSVFLSLAALPAQAAFVLEWSPTSGSSTGGAPIMVDLILRESTTTLMRDFGLVGANLRVNASLGVLSAVGNIGFDLPPSDVGRVSPSEVTIAQGSLTGLLSAGPLTLATFTITPTVNGVGELTVSRFDDRNPGNFAVYSDDSFNTLDLDPQLFSPLTATFGYEVTAVPEPSSIAVLAVMGGVGAYRMRRRAAKLRRRWSERSPSPGS